MLTLALATALVGTAQAWSPPALINPDEQAAHDQARAAQLRQRTQAVRAALAAATNQARRNDGELQALQTRLETARIRLAQTDDALRSQRTDVRDIYVAARQAAGDTAAHLRASAIAPPRDSYTDELQSIAANPRPLDLGQLQALAGLLQEALIHGATSEKSTRRVQVAPAQLDSRPVIRFGQVAAVSGQHRLSYDPLAGLYRVDETVVRLPTQSDGDVYRLALGTPLAIDNSPKTTLRRAGPIGLLIVLLGVIGTGVILIRTVVVTGASRQSKNKRAIDDPLHVAGRDHQREGRENIAAWINMAVRREVRRLSWGHTVTVFIVAAAPLLGLLGTITGMIILFSQLQVYGSGDPTMMADGIAQALTTTLLGLGVAIPMFVAHRWLSTIESNLIRTADRTAAKLTASL